MSYTGSKKKRVALKAGGGQSSALFDHQGVGQFTPVISHHLDHLFNALVSSNIRQEEDGPPLTSYDQFIEWFHSPASAALAPPLNHDLSFPLCNYYISSSHNTYLSGNQVYGAATAESYKNVLLRGCRCLEIDVWNGEDEASSVSSSDVEDAAHEHHGTSHQPTRHRAMSKLKSLRSKAKDKLAGSSSSPEKNSSETREDVGDVDGLTRVLSATELAEQRAVLKTEPRVLHGHTLTKDISFREVCQAIRDAAFTTSILPVIVSLEVHCNFDQQQIMVNIMEETWRGYLIDMSGKSYGDIQQLPSPEALRNKILIKVKWTSSTSSGESNNPLEMTRTNDSSQTSGSLYANESSQHKKASKILDSLSRLGVYTRAYSFKSFSQPEARIPTHVFSLDENKLGDIHANHEHGPDMFSHNRNYLVRIYPSSFRLNSSNIDPAFSWRQGAQMVALNWQSLDRGMMLNEGMFAGEHGYVLKPEGFRSNSISNQIHPIRRHLNLTIRLIAGQNLPMPTDKDASHRDHLKSYVQFQLHVDTHGPPGQGKTDYSDHKAGLLSKYTGDHNVQSAGEDKDEDELSLKRKSPTSKTANPDFAQTELTWTGVPDVVEQLSFLRVKVKEDRTIARDDLAAWACIRLDRLRTGYRFLHLLDVNGEPTEGVLLVRIQKDVK